MMRQELGRLKGLSVAPDRLLSD